MSRIPVEFREIVHDVCRGGANLPGELNFVRRRQVCVSEHKITVYHASAGVAEVTLGLSEGTEYLNSN